MSLDLLDLYNRLEKEGIVFCFCGSASQSVVEGIGATLWQRMELQGTQMSIIGRVFPVFVEQMQNIVSHSADRIVSKDESGEELRSGIVIVGYAYGHFFVQCGNFIENADVELLESKLQDLRKMDRKELNALYREERRKAQDLGKTKGAGLGLIEMARKASEPLEFTITPVDEHRSFFSMSTII
ncbi:MAG: SiaB family protein kinase [Desulfomonile sp.]|nr:SiaB family protein kinase [Desulfomonile sp.]